jgi:hypothetical protein
MKYFFSILVAGFYFTVLQTSTVQAVSPSDCAEDNSLTGCIWANGQWEIQGGGTSAPAQFDDALMGGSAGGNSMQGGN